MATTNKKHQLFTLCCLGITSSAAFAADGDGVQGYLGGMTNQLNRDIGDVRGNRYNIDGRFTYQQLESTKMQQKVDLSMQLNDAGLINYSLQEAYIGKKGVFRSFNEEDRVGDQIKIGRQILDWSQVDAFWGLGKLNNRKNFDYFVPGQEGLIGASYESKWTNGIFFKAFASGLYVPEMNPGLDINKKDRTITSRSQWGDPPARSTEIDGVKTPIAYIVDYPAEKDVVFRYSAGATVGVETKHWISNLYFIRKPENQISQQVEVALSQDASTINAYIKPEFYYHDVWGGNLKYRNNDIEMYFSGIGIVPNTFPDGNQQATTYTELKTEKRREAYLGAGISKINDIWGAGFNYIARVSPFDRDQDNLATDPRWNQAVNFFLSRNFNQKFTLMSDIKYDMLTTDRLVMLRGGYNVSKQLLITLGVNMIGTPNNGKSYWSPYTNNDALFLGLRYVY